MSTCNRSDLQTLGSPPVIMPKNLPNHLLMLIAIATVEPGEIFLFVEE